MAQVYYPSLHLMTLESSSECHVTTQSHSNANFGHPINDVIDCDRVIYYFYVLQFFNLECYIVTTLNAHLHKANILPPKEGSHFRQPSSILVDVRPGSKNSDIYRNFLKDMLRTFKANISCVLLYLLLQCYNICADRCRFSRGMGVILFVFSTSNYLQYT